MAVWFRASLLAPLRAFPESPLSPWIHDGELDDAVLQVAATFPMNKMQPSVVQAGLPFDLQEFLSQIAKRNASFPHNGRSGIISPSFYSPAQFQ